MVLSMERWIQKVAVITGANAGIGATLAETLAKHGLNVVGLDINTENMKQMSEKLLNSSGRLIPIYTDISKESEVIKAFKWIEENLGPIHILINNAAIIRQATLLEGSAETFREVFDVNVLGLCSATREAIKSMRKNGVDGHIIHMNSIGGHKVTTLANANVYYATKFSVTALTETLRRDLISIGSKIKITSLSPGYVKTNTLVANNFAKNLVETMDKNPCLSTEDIADAVVYILSTPPNVQVHELIVKPIGEILC